jgi:hypothetical protein
MIAVQYWTILKQPEKSLALLLAFWIKDSPNLGHKRMKSFVLLIIRRASPAQCHKRDRLKPARLAMPGGASPEFCWASAVPNWPTPEGQPIAMLARLIVGSF